LIFDFVYAPTIAVAAATASRHRHRQLPPSPRCRRRHTTMLHPNLIFDFCRLIVVSCPPFVLSCDFCCRWSLRVVVDPYTEPTLSPATALPMSCHYHRRCAAPPLPPTLPHRCPTAAPPLPHRCPAAAADAAPPLPRCCRRCHRRCPAAALPLSMPPPQPLAMPPPLRCCCAAAAALPLPALPPLRCRRFTCETCSNASLPASQHFLRPKVPL
jgi:hypothetical protein